MKSRWRIAAVSAVAILLCLYFVLYARRDDRTGHTSNGPPVDVASETDPAVLVPTAEEATSSDATAPLPTSLAGTQVDGALVVDTRGEFVPTPDAIDFFDYFLSAIGEESDAEIRERILTAVRGRLTGAAAEEAIALLDAYLLYRSRAAGELNERLAGVGLERRLQYVRELRRDVFGAGVAEALFGEEEARWFVDLERRRILMDPALDPDERDRRIANLEADRPTERHSARDASTAHRLLREEEARLRDSGVGESEIERLREERFGKESASRLAQLDAERLEWASRLAAYQAERDELLQGADETPAVEALELLRSRHFEGGELIRARGLDRLDGWPD